MPSPGTGSAVEVRQTSKGIGWLRNQTKLKANSLSTFWKEKVAKRSNWVPFDVTFISMLTPAQEPAGPQSVGGLSLGLRSEGEFKYEGCEQLTCTGQFQTSNLRQITS